MNSMTDSNNDIYNYMNLITKSRNKKIPIISKFYN
jgi:hypothetical protein